MTYWNTPDYTSARVVRKVRKVPDKFDSERNIYMIAAKLFRFKLKVFSKE